ncbi:MAG TPA: PAS domain S-box protein [Myxococcales bacterium]|nr:PAS domain S-box protein [Myxococcales bacterium]
MQRPITVALLGLTSANEALREAFSESGLALESSTGSAGAAAAVIDLAAPDRDELIALARQCYGPLVGILPADADAHIADGLDGFVRAPYAAADLPPLLRALARARRDRDEMLRQTQDLAALLDVTRTFAASGDTDRLLFEVVEKLAGRLTVERCSLVLVDPQRGTGWVVAASDDAMVRELRIDLTAYPEIREVLQTRKPLVIDDARRHPLLDPVREAVDKQGISAAAVVPMVSEGEVVGVLFLRAMARSGFSAREVGFLSIVANATAVALRNAQLVGRVQSERSQEVAARVAAEREVHQLRRYEEFFSHVSDGMAVLDEEGRVLSLNPAGCRTLGVSMEQARGLPWAGLVAPQSEMNAAVVWRELQRGARVLSADLEVQTRDGRRLVLSISAGTVRSQHGRAILSFRDVTEARAMEAELRKTKDFLERLIDATVDGIVAADLRGRILLWNKGAERVTGFSAAETVGKMSVTEVYPPGQARRIMERLRDGAGDAQVRLLRAEVIAKSGEIIPVHLSAALLTEGGKETATVGVFSDLRARLHVEAELQKAQAKLALAEKAKVASELAGAAAHELNQPLTSILGFSELLFRRSENDGKGREELEQILHEAERMALIVRRIGKIARYETMEYVGNRRIVDLERSSEPPPPSGPIVIKD